ncbi:MAG: transglycosylase SLT domain-containing protein [Mucilaginibacter sp.]
MKRLSIFAISIFLLQIVKAAPSSSPDSSRVVSQATQANVLAPKGIQDTVMVPIITPATTGVYQNNVFRRRLDSIQRDVPLDYNEYVQSYIDLYLTPNRREDISRVLGLAKYYFPIYEKAFREAGIPQEIEYLSIVESQLNPAAVSRVGATGPWQFMANTAKMYDLQMDSYVDERRDPVQSSYAAAAYLKDAYQQFGDWLLAIASYNCGKSNVIRAIEMADGATDFWSVRQYLPVETRGYVPAYIAVTYLLKFHNKYHITPRECNYVIKTDTVSVKKMVSLYSVAQVLGIDHTQLVVLNPAYLQQMVNGSETVPRVLVIPHQFKQQYTARYNEFNTDLTSTVPKPSYADIKQRQSDVSSGVTANVGNLSNKRVSGTISYRVQPGDTLPIIVHKFEGSNVEQIKSENGLKSEDVQPGMMLMISRS